MTECPCRLCEKHDPYCHGTCGQYIEWDAENKKKNREIREKKVKAAIVHDTMIRGISRMRKRRKK